MNRDTVLLALMCLAVPAIAGLLILDLPNVIAFSKARPWLVGFGVIFTVVAYVALVIWDRRRHDRQCECCADWGKEGER